MDAKLWETELQPSWPRAPWTSENHEWYRLGFTLEFEVKSLNDNPDFVTLEQNFAGYTGGAHGNSTLFYTTFGKETAKIFIMPLGGKNADEIVDKLKDFSFVIRKALSKKIIMKFLPKLYFVKDNSFDYAEKIENLIKQTNKQG